MNLPENLLDELRSPSFERLVRPSVVAAGRVRVATNDWPPSLEVADAVLAGVPRQPVVLC